MDSEEEFESADEEDEKKPLSAEESAAALSELEAVLSEPELVGAAVSQPFEMVEQEVLLPEVPDRAEPAGVQEHPLSEEAVDPVQAIAAEITQIDLVEDKPAEPIQKDEPDYAELKRSSPVPSANPSTDWGWGGWSSWATSTATQVAAVASKTGKGLSGAMETFEKSMGIPTPEELAAEMSKDDTEEVPGTATETAPPVAEPAGEFKQSEDEGFAGYYPGAGLWSGLSSLSTTGTALLYTGLDHIEKASNQAYEALNDQTTEPGYTGKKEKIRDTAKGTNLMTVLQEAKASYEAEEVISREVQRTMSYLFDERQGLSQLEALDMLSKECVAKLRTYKADSSMQTLFLYIETSMELKDPDSELIIEQLGAAVTDCLKTININLPITKLNHCRYEIAQKLSEMDLTSIDETARPSDIANTATLDTSLYCIADFSARSVEVFKKIAELTLMKPTLEVDVKTQSDTIKFLNEVLCCEIDNIRAQFEQKLKTNDSVSEKDLNTLYLETSNAISYVQEPLYFFVPILQWLVVKGSNAK